MGRWLLVRTQYTDHDCGSDLPTIEKTIANGSVWACDCGKVWMIENRIWVRAKYNHETGFYERKFNAR